MGVSLLRAHIIRTIVSWGLHWGPLSWGNYHMFGTGLHVLQVRRPLTPWVHDSLVERKLSYEHLLYRTGSLDSNL